MFTTNETVFTASSIRVLISSPMGEIPFDIQNNRISVIPSTSGQVFLGSGPTLCAVTKTQDSKIEKLKELINEMDVTSPFAKLLQKEMEKLIEKAEII